MRSRAISSRIPLAFLLLVLGWDGSEGLLVVEKGPVGEVGSSLSSLLSESLSLSSLSSSLSRVTSSDAYNNIRF